MPELGGVGTEATLVKSCKRSKSSRATAPVSRLPTSLLIGEMKSSHPEESSLLTVSRGAMSASFTPWGCVLATLDCPLTWVGLQVEEKNPRSGLLHRG